MADSAEKAVRDIRRKTRRKFSAVEKIRIVLEDLRGEVDSGRCCCTGLGPECHETNQRYFWQEAT